MTLLKAMIASTSAALLVVAVATELVPELARALGGSLLPSLSVALVATLAARVALWLAYRPTPAVAADALPSLTVVVPAFNEGPGVVKTLESIFASDYPPERLRVIAVDDGSTDDTGPALDRALAEATARGWGDRLEVIHLERNQGKRGALYRGFKRATSDVIATIDSDSIVPRDALAHLVAPIARHPEVGGVAGKVLVQNRAKNVITRMLHVRYLLGFDFVRAYQSVLQTVWCCPGAIQAYRRALVAPHLDAWADQRFLGARCTNGDDHAMTNLVLSLGAATRYQATARCFTLVPESTRRLAKMYIRWSRSATREGLRALRFTPRRAWALGPWRGPLVAWDALMQPLAVLLRTASIPTSLALLFAHPELLLRGLLAGTLFSLFYALVYLRSERSSDVLFGVLYGWYALFVLFWIQPFATLTVRRNGWLTRGA
ncbi:MAG: glycosyltransferase [Deltaproteobacteria bacterium]|nr:glycosyltransferase [Deltaproteobacteria bacterium]